MWDTTNIYQSVEGWDQISFPEMLNYGANIPKVQLVDCILGGNQSTSNLNFYTDATIQ